MFLIDIKVNKYFKTEEMWDELLVFVILYLVLILINIKLKKMLVMLVLKNFLGIFLLSW